MKHFQHFKINSFYIKVTIFSFKTSSKNTFNVNHFRVYEFLLYAINFFNILIQAFFNVFNYCDFYDSGEKRNVCETEDRGHTYSTK
jgi:hypothetical protein